MRITINWYSRFGLTHQGQVGSKFWVECVLEMHHRPGFAVVSLYHVDIGCLGSHASVVLHPCVIHLFTNLRAPIVSTDVIVPQRKYCKPTNIGGYLMWKILPSVLWVSSGQSSFLHSYQKEFKDYEIEYGKD